MVHCAPSWGADLYYGFKVLVDENSDQVLVAHPSTLAWRLHHQNLGSNI